mmetsp:Transcript_9193/g.13804  ORF Transcript_9193/g.13804 Transcript_9193/m.13804 type:complete len:157 (+) Transcript_9193:105-575(+)
MTSDSVNVCEWHETLADTVRRRKGNVDQVLNLCRAEQSFWNKMMVADDAQKTCLHFRQSYVQQCVGPNYLLKGVDCDEFGGNVLTRTPFFKSILEDEQDSVKQTDLGLRKQKSCSAEIAIENERLSKKARCESTSSLETIIDDSITITTSYNDISN